MQWDWKYTIEEVIPHLLAVAHITIEVTILSFVIAIVGGLSLMFARISSHVWIAAPTREAIEFIRGTPILVQIFFLFFILPEVGIVLPPITTGVIALGLHNATYVSETFRAALYGVNRGQWEAAIALNLSPYRTYRDIIIPQMIPPIIPDLGNYLVAMFKETPLLSFIAVVEILGEAKLLGVESFQFKEPITIAGLFFMIMSLFAAAAVARLEVYVRRRILHR